MIHVGVDPGLSGAIASLNSWGTILDCRDMPTRKLGSGRNEIDGPTLVDWFRDYQTRDRMLRVTIELPGVRPQQHAASGIKTGIGWGRIVGMLEALEIAYDVVSPQRWQKAILGALEKGTAKDVAKAFAQRTWPKADLGKRKTQDRSDALCLALFGMRQWGGGDHVRGERVQDADEGPRGADQGRAADRGEGDEGLRGAADGLDSRAPLRSRGVGEAELALDHDDAQEGEGAERLDHRLAAGAGGA